MQHESVDLDVPEEKIRKRASAEILEAERLDDLEACMVSLVINGVRRASAGCIIGSFRNWGISLLEADFLLNTRAEKQQEEHQCKNTGLAFRLFNLLSKLQKTNLIYQCYTYYPEKG